MENISWCFLFQFFYKLFLYIQPDIIHQLVQFLYIASHIVFNEPIPTKEGEVKESHWDIQLSPTVFKAESPEKEGDIKDSHPLIQEPPTVFKASSPVKEGEVKELQ